jgi:hypothetical protein
MFVFSPTHGSFQSIDFTESEAEVICHGAGGTYPCLLLSSLLGEAICRGLLHNHHRLRDRVSVTFHRLHDKGSDDGVRGNAGHNRGHGRGHRNGLGGTWKKWGYKMKPV